MATKKSTAAKSGDAITLIEVSYGEATCFIKGTSPLIFNRVQEKAKRELLLPMVGRKTAAFRAQNIKHDPVAEFRGSVYRWADDTHPARLKFPSTAFKGALASAALEVPGAKKAQIGRLVWVQGYHIDIFGLPELFMAVVRSADINKTPDIRTRAILPEWACQITIRYIKPTLTQATLATLLQWSGLVIAVGDGRQEKGKLNFGQFVVCNQNDPDYLRIVKTGGREAQDAALEEARPHDQESEELLEWYTTEITRRGRKEDELPEDDEEELEEDASA